MVRPTLETTFILLQGGWDYMEAYVFSRFRLYHFCVEATAAATGGTGGPLTTCRTRVFFDGVDVSNSAIPSYASSNMEYDGPYPYFASPRPKESSAHASCLLEPFLFHVSALACPTSSEAFSCSFLCIYGEKE